MPSKLSHKCSSLQPPGKIYLTPEQLEFFFSKYDLVVLNAVLNLCHLSVRTKSSGINVYSAMWLLMASCFITRALVNILLNKHPCVPAVNGLTRRLCCPKTSYGNNRLYATISRNDTRIQLYISNCYKLCWPMTYMSRPNSPPSLLWQEYWIAIWQWLLGHDVWGVRSRARLGAVSRVKVEFVVIIFRY